MLAPLVPAAQEYGVAPRPSLVLGSDRVGEAPEHRLQLSVVAGELETYEALVDYGPEFSFLGFDRLGPFGTAVGAYELDLNGDGNPDVAVPMLSTGPFGAFLDLIGDGDFSPDLEPVLAAEPSGRLYLRLPFGGDALSTTVEVPRAATARLVLFAGLLANPDQPGRYEIEARLTSVDPDTDGPSDALAPDPLQFAASLEVTIRSSGPLPLAELRVERGAVGTGRGSERGWFLLQGTYAMDASSDGIDPDKDAVSIGLGSFAETLPAGALRRGSNGYVLRGRSGVQLLQLRDDGRFVLSSRSVDLSGLDLRQPVRFELQVGDDAGETELRFSRHGRLLR